MQIFVYFLYRQKYDFYVYGLKNGLNWKYMRTKNEKLVENDAENCDEKGAKVIKKDDKKRDEDELEVSENISSYLNYLREKDSAQNYAVDPNAKWLSMLQKVKIMKQDYKNEWMGALSSAMAIKMNEIGEENKYWKVYEFLNVLLCGEDIPILENYDEFTINIVAELMEELETTINSDQVLDSLELVSDEQELPIEPEDEEELPVQEQEPVKTPEMELLEHYKSIPLFRKLENYLCPFEMNSETRKEFCDVLSKISSKLDQLEQIQNAENDEEDSVMLNLS